MAKKNALKKILALTLATALTLGAAPLSGLLGSALPFSSIEASAAEEIVWTPISEDAFTVTDGVLTWTDNGLSGNISLPEGIVGIAEWAFYYCDNLTGIKLPDSVTSISNSAFYGCSSLKNIIISKGVTTIHPKAFMHCTNLSSFYVDENNAYYSSDERGILFNKDKTTLTKYPEGNPSTSYSIPNNVTTIENYAFESCPYLTSITIPDSITNIYDLSFNNCSSLVYINVAENNTLFSNDERGVLFNKDKTTLIKYPANNPSTSYPIPDSVTKIKHFAFESCSYLTSITIPDSITTIYDLSFDDCSSLVNINVAENNALFSSDERGVLFNKDKTTLIKHPAGNPSTSYYIPDSVTVIEDYAFEGCSYLENISMSDTVLTIKDWVFNSCSSLTNITISNNTTSIGYSAFGECSALTDITIPASVTEIDEWAFSNCSSLASITIPDSVTSLGNHAFAYCSSLTNITIPNGVTNIGDSTFSGCSALTSITIPNSVTSIGNYAFEGCSSLTSITIPNSVSYIGNVAFSACDSITSIDIPADVSHIGGAPFLKCYSLKSINVDENNACYSSDENGVLFNKDKTTLIQYPLGNSSIGYSVPNSVTTIDSFAFLGCSQLSQLVIPKSVTKINELAIVFNSKELTDVYYLGTEEEWNSIPFFERYPTIGANTTIHFGAYPESSIIAEKAEYIEGEEIALSVSNGIGSYAIAWYVNGEKVSNETAYSTVAQPGKLEIEVKFTDETGTTVASDKIIINVKGFEDKTYKFNGQDLEINVTYDYDCFDSEVDLSISEVEGEREKGSIEFSDQEIEEQIGCFNIKMILADGSSTAAVQPNGEVTVKMAIPEDYIGRKNYKIVHRCSDGTRENFTSAPSGKDKKLSISSDGKYWIFNVSSFSEFEFFAVEPIPSVSIKNKSDSTTINYGDILRLTAVTENLPDDARIYWYVNDIKQGEGESFDFTGNASAKITVKIVDANGNDYAEKEISDSQSVTVKAGFFQKLISFFKNLFRLNRIIEQSF